jgi:hypothetical protein
MLQIRGRNPMVDEVRVFKLCFYIMSSFATEDQCWNTDT